MKILKFIKKYKKASVLIIITVILFIVVSFLKKTNIGAPGQPGSPLQSETPFKYVSKTPAEDTINSPWEVEPITFIFNKPVNANSLVYSVNPNLSSKVKFEQNNPNQLSIVPLDGLKENVTYVIEITHVESQSGQVLDKNIKTTITRIFHPEDFPFQGE